MAALAGALGAALVEMVANLTVGRKKYQDVDSDARAILTEASQIREELSTAILADAAAFDAVMAVYRDKSLSGEAKNKAVEAATVQAGEEPLRVARACRDVAYLSETIVSIGNKNAVTDAASAALLARAAVQAAALNVKINGAGLANKQLAHHWKQEVDALEEEVSSIAEAVIASAAEIGGF